jgi:DNA-directed RNA polymerase subunit RPC12/RpoP
MQIKCPNCGYEGPAKRRKNRTSALLTALLILGGFFFIWLWVLGFIALIWFIFEKRDASCPSCGWEHVVKIATASANR